MSCASTQQRVRRPAKVFLESRELSVPPIVLPANIFNESELLADEIQIVAAVLAGRTNEFRKLVEQYHQPVYRFARNMIGDEHDAEDITQEVFLAAFDHLASYNSKRASLLTWLFTIARNRCVNHLKRTRPVIDSAVIAISQPAATSDDSARNEFWSRLDEALEALPLEQRTAFILAEISGLKYAEIAHIEKTTLGAVKSRIHRAKLRLRAIMAPTLGEQ